jgi:hypothetical protein
MKLLICTIILLKILAGVLFPVLLVFYFLTLFIVFGYISRTCKGYHIIILIFVSNNNCIYQKICFK